MNGNYEKVLMTDQQIIESRKPKSPEQDALQVRIHAREIRRKLANGYPAGSRFLLILAQIPDAQLVMMQAEHDADKREHLALTAMYVQRKKTEKANPMARLTRLAMQAHQQ
jgi:hypothetical protein